jgi:hypothetical protein
MPRPRAAPQDAHARRHTAQSKPKIATLFDQLLANGVVITECPFSTSDCVKAIDRGLRRSGVKRSFRPSVSLKCLRFVSRSSLPSNTGG